MTHQTHLRHEHLLVRAKVKNPLVDKTVAHTWLTSLIQKIGMNILAGPLVEDCTIPGNEGLSGVVILSTSHSVLHVWPKDEVPTVQFDLYSCSNIDLDVVFDHFKVMEPLEIEYKFLDRDNHFKSLKYKPKLKAA